ncbi:RNA-editing ligase [Angomonas deanei]|uniref:Uncharacterized protein n=1 Tax=Angomonas deanei TaxID=59799 RepID=S9WJV7_9TRYP|nr:RNA-editing ligase [Angomonas deanei]EPY39571.1 RNA-editing ligase [Angomonas deanei]CAD2215128.1 hypothetical protein, conserved [Angomonas deanei]|eukprot:EPY29047.1 RNA-editing ligase [Angomonas deanei]
MQYKIAPYAPTFTRLTYDAALRIFEQVPGLLYAKPILRGPLYKILAFNVDKFQTTIPAQLGLGNYPLQDNWAEGIVVRHARRGEPLFDKTHSKAETLFKIKSTAFQEISTDPADGPRTDVLQSIRHHAMTSQGVQLPAMESVIGDPHLLQATEHLLRHICHARLTNTLSKLGTEPFESEMTPEILADALLRDALTDFLKEADLETVNAPITMRREMVRYAALYSRKFVIGEWSKILQNVEEKSAAG